MHSYLTSLGFVYHDEDSDNLYIPGNGDAPLKGVQVSVHSVFDGSLVGTTVTNEFGRYTVHALLPGLTYTVELTPLATMYKAHTFSFSVGDLVTRFDTGFVLNCDVCEECSDYYKTFKYQREWIHEKYHSCKYNINFFSRHSITVYFTSCAWGQIRVVFVDHQFF